MASGLLSLKWNHHRSTFLHVLANIRQKESYCDVTLACAGKFYSAHKLVLSTCSEYFEEMFERTDCKHPVIVLKDIGADELEALLSYMYDGEVNVLQENLSSLIKAAECLKIKGLAVADHDPSEQPIKDIKSASGGGGGSSSSKDGAVNRSHSNNSGYHHPSDNSSSNSSSRQFRNSTSSSMGGGLKRPNKVDDSQPIKRRRPAATVDASSPARRPSDKSKDPSSKSPSKEGGAADDAAAAAASGDEATNNSVDGVAGDDHASSDGHDDARSFAQGLSEETGVKAEPVEIIDSDDLNYEGGAGGGASDAEFTEEKFAGGAADGGDPNSLWGAGDAADLFSQPSTSFGDGGGSNSGGTTNDTAGGGKAGGSSSGPEQQQHRVHLHQHQAHEHQELPSHFMHSAPTQESGLVYPSAAVNISPRSNNLAQASAAAGKIQYHCSSCPFVTDELYTYKNHVAGHRDASCGGGGRISASADGFGGSRTQHQQQQHPGGGGAAGAHLMLPLTPSSHHQGGGGIEGFNLSENESDIEIQMINQVFLGQGSTPGTQQQQQHSLGGAGGGGAAFNTSMSSHGSSGGGVGYASDLLECPFCAFTTNKQSAIDSHIKTHTGEKPFSCPICSKGFSRKNNLQVHMKIHTGEKPFGCPQCSYRSSQKSNLKLHMLSHTGLKPFACPYCDYKSTQKINLKMHIYKKHPPPN